jgi:hypothetical protein
MANLPDTEMKTRSGLSSSTEKDHEENRTTAMKRSLINHVKNNMTDPFDVEAYPKDLINSARGVFYCRYAIRLKPKLVDIGHFGIEVEIKQ